ncbi:hypothetical protein V8F20_002878 [Naviculisporaceae sp. PSN 640]
MKSLFALTLPALAMAAALVSPRQAPDVRVLSARSLSDGPGSGCPNGHFGTFLNTATNTLTIIFDKYVTSIGPGVEQDVRELFCDFEVTFSFPVGCTTGVIHNAPSGEIRLENRFESSFAAQYTIEKGQITQSPPEIRYNSSTYGAPEGTSVRFESDHPAGVRVTINTDTERNVVYRASTRIFLNQPGIAPSENSTFDVLNTDIYILDVQAC